MNDTAREIIRLSQEGYCCSQVILQLGLDSQGDDNPQLVDAVKGLCGGLYSGLICGTLTGAACLLSMFDKDKAKAIMIPALVEWFQATYTPLYGGITCECIACGDPATRLERCPQILEDTYQKCRALLAEYGYEI
jgi:hypothetical protein